MRLEKRRASNACRYTVRSSSRFTRLDVLSCPMGNYSARSHDRDSDQYTFRSAARTGIRYSTSAAELGDSSSQIQSRQTTIFEGIFHRSETGNHQELAAEP